MADPEGNEFDIDVLSPGQWSPTRGRTAGRGWPAAVTRRRRAQSKCGLPASALWRFRRVVASSPCVDVRLPRTPTKAVSEVLEPEQVLALADAVPPRYRALVISGAGLGLRPGELFGLAVDRLQFLKRTVRVDQQMVRVRGEGVRLAQLKTAASYRTIPLPDVVGQAIAGHLQTWPADPQLGLVVTNERGVPIQQ